jgi:hypothetical protein
VAPFVFPRKANHTPVTVLAPRGSIPRHSCTRCGGPQPESVTAGTPAFTRVRPGARLLGTHLPIMAGELRWAYARCMDADRRELHALVDALPDEALAPLLAELRSRLRGGDGRRWPPAFVGMGVDRDAQRSLRMRRRGARRRLWCGKATRSSPVPSGRRSVGSAPHPPRGRRPTAQELYIMRSQRHVGSCPRVGSTTLARLCRHAC